MGMYKLGLDIGNSGIKIAGKANGEVILKYVKALATEDSTDTENVVLIDGNTRPVHFGVGEPLTLQDKTKRPYLKEILLLSLVMAYGDILDCDAVKVGIGLPLKDYKNEHKRRRYQEELNKITSVSGFVNNKHYVFNISISIKAEGYSAFYYISGELDKNYKWVIPDHGYRSTDAVVVAYDSAVGRWKIENYESLNIGLLEMYTSISTYFSEKTHEDTVDAKDIEYYMKENTIVVTSNEHYPEINMNDYSEGAINVIENIYRKLELKFSDMHLCKILLMGGGSELVYKHLNRANVSIGKTEVERLYGNAIGFFLQL